MPSNGKKEAQWYIDVQTSPTEKWRLLSREDRGEAREENADFRAGEYVVVTGLGSQATGVFKLVKAEPLEPGKVRLWTDSADDVSVRNIEPFLRSVRPGDQVSLMSLSLSKTKEEDQEIDIFDVPGVSVDKDEEGRVSTLTLPNVEHVTRIDKTGEMKWARVIDVLPNVERTRYAFVTNSDTEADGIPYVVDKAFYDLKANAMTLNVRDLSSHKKSTRNRVINESSQTRGEVKTNH